MKFDYDPGKKREPKDSRSYQDHLKDPCTGLYIENFFREMLVLERRRKERSKQSFLLMLVDFHKDNHGMNSGEVLKDIAQVLLTSTRETDFKGWYRQGQTMGVIFSELSQATVDEAKNSIQKKFNQGLEMSLGPKVLSMLTITFHVFPEDAEKVTSHSTPNLRLYPDLQKKESDFNLRTAFKRAMDMGGSITILFLFSPFLLLIAAAIKLTSKGPVLFTQKRVGQYGKPFTFLKFRSMVVNNDENIHKEYVKQLITSQKSCTEKVNGGANGTGEKKIYKIERDPRVTAIGRFIRKTSLDEFPQFINVLKGDMSLVGPRPPIPYELECYDTWHKRRILEMKPGITGIWQVSGRSTTTFDEMVRLDLNYTRNWSLWLDMKLLFITPWVIITGKGGY